MIFDKLFCKHKWVKKEEIKTFIQYLSMEERCTRITYVYICKNCGKIKKVNV